MKNRSIHPLWAEIKHLPLSRLFPSSLLVETDRLHRLLTLLVRTQRRFLVQGLEVVNRGLEPLIRKLALAVEPAPNLLQVEILLIIRSLHHIPLYILDRNILLLSFPLIWQLLKFLNRHIVLLLLLPSLIPHVWDVTKIIAVEHKILVADWEWIPSDSSMKEANEVSNFIFVDFTFMAIALESCFKDVERN